MNLINGVTKNLLSDEWYTDQETVDLCWLLLGVEHGDVICCPFDSEESLFVKKAKLLGHEVIYGISNFLDSENYKFDKLITNPPFSIKDLVIQKVYEYNKPGLLILPMDSLGGVKRHSLYREYSPPAVFMPTRRVSYYDENWNKRGSANFHSIILRFNMPWIKPLTWEFEK